MLSKGQLPDTQINKQTNNQSWLSGNEKHCKLIAACLVS